MMEDCNILDTLIIKYKYNKIISNEIEKLKEKWIKEFTKINTDVDWDKLDEAELNFDKLREKDKLYIKEFISIHYNSGDNKKEDDSFEQRFSFFYDFDANQQLFDIKTAANKEIFERITQEIFNASLAKW